jgi:hypothetical protein
MAIGTETEEIPSTLFHTTLTVIDYHTDTSGSTQTVFPLGTHTTIQAAKSFTFRALEDLGYIRNDFTAYADRGTSLPWEHGDGVLVYAKAPAGQEFLVGIDTKPNNENLPAAADGSKRLVLPKGTHLHYVMQTKIDYNADRAGGIQSTEIEGTYIKRADAIEAAKRCLVDDEVQVSDYAQYDVRDTTDPPDDWPFGEDVFVHAVTQTGENYYVAVRTVPGAHERHAKKQ